jgi:hypothetical protein
MKRNLRLVSVAMIVILATLMVFNACKKDSNSNPVIAAVMVNPQTVSAGAVATITVTATDADGDALTYAYIPNGGAISGTGAMVTWTAPSTAGAYSVTVTVTDGNGGTATSAGALTVQAVSNTTKITGTASFPAGTSGDLSNAKVSIYTSYENWNFNQPIKFTAVQGSGASVTFQMVDVLPGNYYLDVWKDIDNSANWTVSDYVGWYGSGGLGSPNLTEFQISEGQTLNFNISMYIIAKGDKSPK